MTDRRLIEAGFPCHQVGAETQREQSVGLQPPTHRLHVWWARRPLTPSRAAVAGSLLPENANIEAFIKELGIEKQVVELNGGQWVLTGKLLERIEKSGSIESLKVDAVVLRAFDKEVARRAKNLDTIAQLKQHSTELANNPVLQRWEQESQYLGQLHSGEVLSVKRVMGDPSHINERIEFAKSNGVKDALGSTIKWDAEDLYAYGRAFQNDHVSLPSSLTVLDPTSGGGSIPFEALRLGHNVIANELNPVASTILHATLDFPARFGVSLYQDIESWGHRLLERVEREMAAFTPFSPLPEYEKKRLKNHLENCPDLFDQFNVRESDQNGILYCRQVTCPSCSAKTPLLNTHWLSKEAKDQWGVRVVTSGTGASATYRFETYQAKNGNGPNGENPDQSTCKRGIGQCIHCKQAIEADEIKSQARGESIHGQWKDELYAVVAVRHQPKLDKKGLPQYFATGPRKGEIKTEKVRFFRSPNQTDYDAIEAASAELKAQWDRFDEQGLIPTEKFPDGNDMRPAKYGMERWYKLFNDRQLLGHLTAMETLSQLKPQIISELGQERGRAVITYLQFALDKVLDYNSRQTRWEFTRGVVKGTFGRHDFSLKWTYGEMVFSGPNSGSKWGLSQVLDAYKGIQQLVNESVHLDKQRLNIINGSGVHIDPVADKSVDLVCMDPPYYDNVQYAELSDYFYVWQKRTLKDLYPALSWSRLTNKQEEAVSSTARDGGSGLAKEKYESLMEEIFSEANRVLKDKGILTLMFTHKKQEAWETLTTSLIRSGWMITSSFPVESEGGNSTHQKDMASAASSIFISCRKRAIENNQVAFWSGLGGSGVQHQIRSAVEAGLDEFRPLKLNAVDQMIACYGRALQVLSENWPVMDGDEEVSPIRAMNEASRVVAEHQIKVITDGNISVDDLDTETAMALTMYGIWGHNEASFTEVLNLSRSLNISLETRTGGYGIEGRMVGINTEISGRTAVAGQAAEDKGYAAPLVKKGSKLRLAKPQERSARRVAKPQSDWDVLHGLLLKFREGDVPVARAYLDEQREGNDNIILDLLEVWGEEAETPEARNEARALLFGLRQ
jgi:adenine-specific DNA methylase